MTLVVKLKAFKSSILGFLSPSTLSACKPGWNTVHACKGDLIMLTLSKTIWTPHSCFKKPLLFNFAALSFSLDGILRSMKGFLWTESQEFLSNLIHDCTRDVLWLLYFGCCWLHIIVPLLNPSAKTWLAEMGKKSPLHSNVHHKNVWKINILGLLDCLLKGLTQLTFSNKGLLPWIKTFQSYLLRFQW